jgi:hypothetical protein
LVVGEVVAAPPGLREQPQPTHVADQVVLPILARQGVAAEGADAVGEPGELGVDEPRGGPIPERVRLAARGGEPRTGEVLEPDAEVLDAGVHLGDPARHPLRLRLGIDGAVLAPRRPAGRGLGVGGALVRPGLGEVGEGLRGVDVAVGPQQQ